MIFNGKVLDEFQVKAINSINSGESVIVSAPTGTGKTLVADYCIDKLLNEGKRVVYTAPVKALSNQKFKEFSLKFGTDNVGMLTGDTVINKNASLLIMTTEVYKNILYADREFSLGIACVIFDEIHYIADRDRGTVWEESLLLKPSHTMIVGLSATIPNIGDFASWIEEISGKKVNMVIHKERAVPLSHKAYVNGKIIDVDDVTTDILSNIEDEENDYINLLNLLRKENFPLLYFSFNRRGCMEKAETYARQRVVKDVESRKVISEKIHSILESHDRDEKTIGEIGKYKFMFNRGVGIHHAGIQPILKLIVEELFEAGLIDVVFCTETFAIGINFPVKTVCIDGYRKFDGEGFRNLYNKEYFQIAGRAGRRGVDEFGDVIVIFRKKDMKYGEVPAWDEGNMELLESNFRVSYNATIQMASEENDSVKRILKDNFALYLMKKQKEYFASSKTKFFGLIDRIKRETCNDYGKRTCPVTKKRDAQFLNEKIQKGTGVNISQLKKDLSAINRRSVKNCEKGLKKLCESHYDVYIKAVEKYTRVKERNERYRKSIADGIFDKEYAQKLRLLTELGYYSIEDGVLVRGETLKSLYIQELLVAELIYSDFFEKYGEEVICAIVSSIGFDGYKSNPSKLVNQSLVEAFSDVFLASEKLILIERTFTGVSETVVDSTPCNLVYLVAMGGKVMNLSDTYGVGEGDIINVVRRTVALLSEIKDSVTDRPAVEEKIRRCINLLDRDEYVALY